MNNRTTARSTLLVGFSRSSEFDWLEAKLECTTSWVLPLRVAAISRGGHYPPGSTTPMAFSILSRRIQRAIALLTPFRQVHCRNTIFHRIQSS